MNFSFGVKTYREQLNNAVELIRGHKGPVIMGGDFTFSLPGATNGNECSIRSPVSSRLIAVPFSPDHRTTQFGKPLDHVYVRELAWRHAETKQVNTSDHNPLLVTFRGVGP